MKYIYLYKQFFAGLSTVLSNQCLLRDYGNYHKVCVCNEHFCDTIDPVTTISQGSYWKYTSNREGKRFEKLFGRFTTTYSHKNSVTINPAQVYQKMNGFGGAFTDAAGINIMLLSENLRDKVMT